MQRLQNKKLAHLSLAVFMAVSSLSVLAYTQHAHADTFGQVFVRFDRMQKSTTTTGTVCAEPSLGQESAVEGKVIVTFPTSYALGAFGTFTVNSTSNSGWPSGASAWTGVTAPTGAGDITGQSVTFAAGDLASHSTLYCFNWTNAAAVTQPGTAAGDESGTVATKTTGGTAIDTGSYATATVDNDTVQVNATVPPLFSLTIPVNTDNLPTLTLGGVSSSQATKPSATVNTNAKNGWMVWAKDSSTGLHSTSASYTIPAKTYSGAGPTTVTAGSEGYNTGITSSQAGGSGTLTVDTGFASGGAGQGGGLTTTNHVIASSTGSADTAVLTITNNAAIKGSTPAATDYTDTITITGAGLF